MLATFYVPSSIIQKKTKQKQKQPSKCLAILCIIHLQFLLLYVFFIPHYADAIGKVMVFMFVMQRFNHSGSGL